MEVLQLQKRKKNLNKIYVIEVKMVFYLAILSDT